MRMKVNGDITVKGRNGYFKLDEVAVLVGTGERNWIELRSAKSRKDPPSQLRGSKEDLLTVLVPVVDALRDRNHWEDDPEYSSEEWRAEVCCNDTRLGYLEWVEAQRDRELCETLLIQDIMGGQS